MRPPHRLVADTYRWAEIARREPLWATTGAGARGASRRVDRGDLGGVLGVAEAFPRLVSHLARACDDHETDAPRFVLAEVTSGHSSTSSHYWLSVEVALPRFDGQLDYAA